jgi:hypothetical protein
MPLPGFPTRDPRPDDGQHAREYDPDTGGWTKPTAPADVKKESK